MPLFSVDGSPFTPGILIQQEAVAPDEDGYCTPKGSCPHSGSFMRSPRNKTRLSPGGLSTASRSPRPPSGSPAAAFSRCSYSPLGSRASTPTGWSGSTGDAVAGLLPQTKQVDQEDYDLATTNGSSKMGTPQGVRSSIINQNARPAMPMAKQT